MGVLSSWFAWLVPTGGLSSAGWLDRAIDAVVSYSQRTWIVQSKIVQSKIVGEVSTSCSVEHKGPKA